MIALITSGPTGSFILIEPLSVSEVASFRRGLNQ
ncbi:hypothetical protein VPHD292_0052 [Vibrio phage D292]